MTREPPLTVVQDVAGKIEELYRGRFQSFRRMAAAITGDWDSAFDAVQDGFASAYARRATFRGEGSLEAWVWTIVLRTAVRQRSPAAVETAGALESLALPDAERHPELDAALRGLPPKRRLVVFLRYFADLPYSRIAEVVGSSEGTVAATLSQAHAQLARALEEAELHR